MCIPVYGGYDLFTQCFASVLRHTEPEFPILVCDDASVEPRFPEFVRSTLEDGALAPRRPVPAPTVERRLRGQRQRAFAAAAPADVIILNSDTIVSGGWARGLRAAALQRLQGRHGHRADERRHDRLGAAAQPSSAVSARGRDGRRRRGRDPSRGPRLYPESPRMRRPLRLRPTPRWSRRAFDLWFSPDTRRRWTSRSDAWSTGCATCSPTTSSSSTAGWFFRDPRASSERRTTRSPPCATRTTTPWMSRSRRRAPAPGHLGGRASVAIRGTSVTIDGRCLTPGDDGHRTGDARAHRRARYLHRLPSARHRAL